MKSPNPTAICFGEVLWDIFPAEKVAGGAPMNVAIRLQSLGITATIISKIGNDVLGKDLLQIINEKQVNTSFVQVDNTLPTGEVQVHLDTLGTPSYTIVQPSAWDAIEWNEHLQHAVAATDVFVFGSLVCRNDVSKKTLLQLLEVAKFKVFDVNLRSPYYNIELLIELMQKADLIKLNDEELNIIAGALNASAKTIEEQIQFITALSNTPTICVTKGKDGAVLYSNNQFYTHLGFKVVVADTVGAGDSFLAALIMQLLLQKEPAEILPFACAIGSLVASKKGANANITFNEIEDLMNTE
jgi:fructokinase